MQKFSFIPIILPFLTLLISSVISSFAIALNISVYVCSKSWILPVVYRVLHMCSFYLILKKWPLCPMYDFCLPKHVSLYMPVCSYLSVVGVFSRFPLFWKIKGGSWDHLAVWPHNFFATGTCLLSRCLATAILSSSTISAFRRHVTFHS
jgi:hypothetical protein